MESIRQKTYRNTEQNSGFQELGEGGKLGDVSQKVQTLRYK